MQHSLHQPASTQARAVQVRREQQRTQERQAFQQAWVGLLEPAYWGSDQTDEQSLRQRQTQSCVSRQSGREGRDRHRARGSDEARIVSPIVRVSYLTMMRRAQLRGR